MTKAELEARLRNEGFREDYYSLNGSLPPYEGYILVEVHGVWLMQHLERGSTEELARFTSEEAACDAFYARLSRDPTLRQRPRTKLL